MNKETKGELTTIKNNIQKVTKPKIKSNNDVSLHMGEWAFESKTILQQIVSYNVEKDNKVSYRVMHSILITLGTSIT